MTLKNVGVVFRKELRDILRDRRSVMFMIVVPIVGVPIFMKVVTSITTRAARKLAMEDAKVVVVGGSDSPRALAAIRSAPKVQVIDPTSLPELSQKNERNDLTIEVPGVAGLIPWIDSKDIQAVVAVPEAFDADLAAGRPSKIRVFYDQAEDKSELTYERRLRPALETLRKDVTRERLSERAIPESLLEPFDVLGLEVAAREKAAGKFTGMLLPYLIIILCFTGALFPAFDLGAGEKERGTLETLLVSPAARSELVMGKFLLILFASVVSTSLSLLSMGYAFKSGFAGEGGRVVSLEMPPAAIALSFAMVLPIAAVFASLLLSISIFAKNYREAQALAGPLNMVIFLPAIVSMLPGVSLDWKFALVPVVNVSLALKDAFQGIYKPELLALIFVSTLGIAIASVVFCARWFSREAVLFRS